MKLKKRLNENLSDTTNFSSDMEMIRLSITSEMDAINLYEQLAVKAKDKRVKDIFNHIAEEEKHHVGEFIHLLNLLDLEQLKANKKGKEEAIDVIEKEK